jgi:hypothetical protein
MSYLTAVLSDEEIDAISDPAQSHHDALRDLERVSKSARKQPETEFEHAIRIKNTLDAYEEKAKIQPSLEVLAVLLNCEARLEALNVETPMEYKPFLSHWVEAFMRLEKISTKEQQRAVTNGDPSDAITWDEICQIRRSWIGRLLSDKTPITRDHSPQKAYQAFRSTRSDTDSLDVQPWIRMLVETGVWDAPPSHIPTTQSDDINSTQWQKALLEKIKSRPNIAIPDLTHLPLTLPSLDYLTTLLVNRTLENHAIDPATVITSYIQHALRLVEEMGGAPPIPDSQLNNGSVMEYGKEAQIRAVRLLLLFIKNLMRKGLVGPQVLYFEVQEICVRYVWVREVREFRNWVEGGARDGEVDG